MIKYHSSLLLLFTFFSCDWPFQTKSTDGDIFLLSVSHEIVRMIDSAAVYLTWDPMSVEDFSHFRIERKNIVNNDWILVEDVADPLVKEYTDYIFDDENLAYRVGIMDIDQNVLWSENTVLIPATTSLIIPDEWPTPARAFQSPLVDDGDSIFVREGHYEDTLSMIGKTVYVTSIAEIDTAILFSRVVVNAGVLRGFCIKNISSGLQNGGGVYISGSGKVRNCIIKNNGSGRNGGGVYIRQGGSLYNSMLFNNVSAYGSMNIYIENASGKIINNTFVLLGDHEYGSNVSVSNLDAGFTYLNNIIYGAQNFNTDSVNCSLVTIDYSRMDQISICGDSVISDNPYFVNENNTDFHLMPNSSCINSGHPDGIYNNLDGSRNTMGAYGGPNASDDFFNPPYLPNN